ncbi:hypothetical protein GGX14DRAFT_415110 [Mycena pura]|uniref:C3H1-type domain-containing protein n=1 Tax=Mycena pura TaxID=153505 RepID=A0AAD6YTD1_9AGAR|nr:hypothetical protein GGX14DRAFT_415110 [Mycena pura]
MEVATSDTTHIFRTMQNRMSVCVFSSFHSFTVFLKDSEHGFDQLKNDVFNMMNLEISSQERIQQLEKELNVYKIALDSLKTENTRLRKLEDEHQHLKDSVKGYRVITLIDGDGAIFSSELVSRGVQGGHHAARILSDSITQHLTANYGARPYQLWVYLFYNKRGLTDTFGRVGLGSLNSAFEDFVVGFNQATERFTMVDVGSTKEAADVKIKVHLEDDIRLPQTFKIIFGGCHDNGYVSSLHSQITAGFRDKLILLKAYTQLATAIAALDLPLLEIADLFIAQKLASPRWMPPAYYSPNQMVTDTDHAADESSKMLSGEASDEVDATGLSYSRVLQRAAPNLRESRTRERSPSTEASWEGHQHTPGTGTRHINPSLRLSKQKPPPCTLFYLSNCKHGSNCKYGHDYLLNDEHYREMRENARLAPCPSINRGEMCTWGDACCYGHVCPHSTKCPFFRIGTCKFKGGDMHRDPAGV